MMQSDLPLRNLYKYSCRCAVGVGSIVLVTGSTVEPVLSLVAFKALTTFTLFFASCLINICLLRFIEKKVKVVDPEFSGRRFLLGYAATTAFLIGLHSLNMILVDKGIFPPEFYELKAVHLDQGGRFWVHMLSISLIVFTLVYFFHNFILLQFARSRTEIELSKLKTANFESANQLLRQQIQPHFLFNALNVLKSLIRKYPGTAEEYLIRLSDFLRASLTENKADTATVRQELKLCEDYMEMQKIRFGNAIQYKVCIFDFDCSMNKYLPFFSLQPLLENAIKHNQLTDATPLRIDVKRDGEWIKVTNNLQPKNFVEGSTGNGLYNLKERYRILSGDEVDIIMTGKEFSVKIKILDHEYRRHRG